MKKTKAKVNTGATLRTVLRHITRYTPRLVLSIVLAAVIVGLTLYIPILAGEAIDLYLIEIPPTHHGLAVTEILDGGFADAPNLIEIKIANSIKRIGKDAAGVKYDLRGGDDMQPSVSVERRIGAEGFHHGLIEGAGVVGAIKHDKP